MGVLFETIEIESQLQTCRIYLHEFCVEFSKLYLLLTKYYNFYPKINTDLYLV